MPVLDLSPTEERVVLLLAGGWTRGEVAIACNLDERTIDWHVVQATRKLDRASVVNERVRRAAFGPSDQADCGAATEELPGRTNRDVLSPLLRNSPENLNPKG